MPIIQNVPVGGRSELYLDRSRDARIYCNHDGTVNIVYPTMAQDELPRAVLAGAAGGRARDQNGNPDGGIYSTPAEASLARLCAFLRGLLSPDDMAQAETLIGQLFADSDPTDVGSAMAGDRAVSVSYEPRFPNHGRLGRWFS